MGLTTDDLLDPKWTEKDKQEIAIALKNYTSNDVWIKKAISKKIAILLTSHPGNRAYLKASVETHKKLGYWICLAYDNYINPDSDTIDYNSIMPAKDVMDNVDLFIVGHHQKWGGVLFPWFWLLKWGINALQDFDYIYCANADMILEKPEGFNDLFKLLDDADIMTCGHDEPGKYANTAAFIAKSKALKDIVKHMQDHFVPFKVYEKYTQEFGNAEGRLGKAIKNLNLKQVIVDPPNDDMLKVPGKGTFYDLIGLRHIHAEHNYAYRNKKIPPHYKYLDERFMGNEYNLIKQYYDTNNISILEDWWVK